MWSAGAAFPKAVLSFLLQWHRPRASSLLLFGFFMLFCLCTWSCDAIGGSSFGGRFVSRQQIKKWLLEHKDIDCDMGVSKSALKRALVNFEKKGDSYRISKEMRAKKNAAAKALVQKEKDRERKQKLVAKKEEKKLSKKSKTVSKKKPAAKPKKPVKKVVKKVVKKSAAKGKKTKASAKPAKKAPVKKNNKKASKKK